MILTKDVEIFISNKTISYYRNLGYDIIPNQINKIKVGDLLKNSSVKVDTKCDICGGQKTIIYQKYNKNISKYGIYSCSVNCAKFKIKRTNLEKYGNENYVNVDLQRQTIKIKYDKITKDIENIGVIECIKCLVDKSISKYLIKGGRYKHICRECRNISSNINRDKFPHVKIWRGVLRGYLLRKNIKKNDKTLNLLKYSPEELKIHISSQFDDTMDWGNHGKVWHIDHIIHVTLFKDDAPIHLVNSLDNLRPLNARSNISRHNNLDYDCLMLIEKYKTYIKEEYIS